MDNVEKWYDCQYSKRNVTRKVYLATDDQALYKEALTK